MVVLLAILRLVLPILILFLIWRFFLRRFMRPRKQPSDRIDVDATVVKSEQNKVDLEDYEPSEIYVKQQPLDDNPEKKEQ